MKSRALVAAGVIAGLFSALPSRVYADVIDISGAAKEFADYTGATNSTVWSDSAVTEGDFTLGFRNEALRRWNTSWSSGSYVVGAEVNSSQAFDSTQISSDAAGALATSKFITIQLSSVGSPFDLNSVSVTLWRNGPGAAEYYQFAYDGGGNGFDAGDFLGAATQVPTGSTPSTVSYNGAGLPEGVTTADIRLYFWGGTSGTGNTHYTNVVADYTVIPEPSSLVLVSLAGLVWMARARRRARG